MSGRLNRVVTSLVLAFTIGVSFVFLFARLGHYALWSDEANTALLALGFWRTGDVTAKIGSNVVAFNGGTTLTGFRERYVPPLSFYLAAIPVGLSGGAFAARLPFALCGLASVGLMLRWAWRERIDEATWILLALALTGNISLYLYSRQCRYYALAMLCSVALAYLYRFRSGRLVEIVAFSLISIALFATNYMSYVALYACLALDYLLWERKRQPLTSRERLWLLGSWLIVCAPIAFVWNPLLKKVADYQSSNWFADKATLFLWNWRDMARCEFGVGLLLLAAPWLALLARQAWLMRVSVALVVYVSIITIVSPQPVGMTFDADVRYLAPAIPLCIVIGVMALRSLEQLLRVSVLPLGILAFWTSLLPGGRDYDARRWSTLGEYIHELARPPRDPFTEAASWINTHVVPGQTVLVRPDYMAYPLMYHAPHAVYAWQFRYPPDPEFLGLDPVHYFGQVPPDYAIAFGFEAKMEWKSIKLPTAIRYRQVDRLGLFWRQMQRPELIWRSFRSVDDFDEDDDSIFIYQREDDARSPELTRRGEGESGR